MSNKDIEELLAEQNTVGTRLQQAINNYKKSPIDRKTLAYVEKYYKDIQDLWQQFDRLDNRLRTDTRLSEDHAYFKDNVHSAIGAKFNEIYTKMEAEINELRKKAFQSVPIKDNDTATQILKQKSVYETTLRMIDQVLETSEQTSQFYKTKLRAIEQHWEHVTTLHKKLWTSADYDYENYIKMEEVITDGIIQIQERISSEEIPSNFNSKNQDFKLPKIELPKFDGTYLNWRNFHDLFSELVDKRPIPACQKLLYLKSSLAGEAEGLVHNFSTTSDNYNIAWTTLKNRYENKRVLVNSLLKKLLSQPSASHENVSSLKLLHDTTQECLHSLQNLNINTETWDPILLHILLQRLSKQTHMLWEQSLTDPQALPQLTDFLNFIKIRFQSLEASGDKLTTTRIHIQKNIRSFGASIIKADCSICHDGHPIFACQSFLKMTTKERLQAAQKAQLCVNCLRPGHNAKGCKSSNCTKCNKKHNTLLHLSNNNTNSSQSNGKDPQSSNIKPSQVAVSAVGVQTETSAVLLSTVCVYITDLSGQKHRCRALLDSGSQANFISKSLVNKLGLHVKNSMIAVEGICQTQSQTYGRMNIELSSTTSGFSKRIEVLVIPKIVSCQPSKEINTTNWKIPSNIKLSDAQFATPSQIDLLIGAGLFYSILSIGQVALGPGLPILQNTLLGWVIGGEYDTHNSNGNLHCGVGIIPNLDENLEKFWKLEEFEPRSKAFTAAEIRCENHFLQNVRKHSDGRYIVKLPFQNSPHHLGESREIALQRFKAIERKLEKNPQIREEYHKFMKEYEELNHMQELAIDEIPRNHCFLPHHAVFKRDSTTTKTRVVFDASAKTSSNYALNDILYTGPTIQADVFTSILRFRFPRYAFTADIEKMYRQVWVNQDDRNFQLIWWRDDPSKPLRCMQLSTVTYGTTCAPYLATRILKLIADTNQEKYPLAATALKNNFYVDDVIVGTDKITTTLELQQQLREVLQSSGLNLRKWCANDERLLEKIPYYEREVSLDMPGSAEENIKTMGITWYPKKDVFAIKITQEYSHKILHTNINLCPEKATLITLTCCYLHNFISSRKNSATYLRSSVDEVNNLQLDDLEPANYGNVAMDAKNIREKFCNYFNTVGAVAWQNDHV